MEDASRDGLNLNRVAARSGKLCVTHILDGLGPEQGGTLTFTSGLCVALKKIGADVKLAVMGLNDRARRLTSSEMNVVFTSLPYSFYERNRSRELLKRSSLVHLHTPWSLKNIAIAHFLRKHRIPYVVTTHGMLDRWSLKQKSLKKKVFLSLLGKRFLIGAEFVHCTAEEEKVQAIECYDELRKTIRVIPCLFDDTEYSSLFALRENKLIPRVLFLSRLHPKKGCEILLDAVRLLVDQGGAFTVAIVGPSEPWYLRLLMERTASLGLNDIVTFYGMASRAEKLEHYRCADIFALPTFQENFGYVLVEAMASGLPLVTTSNTDIWFELKAGGAQIVENKPAAFASAIGKILSNRDARSAVGRQGMSYISTWLNCDKTIDKYVAMYLAAARR